eukprot:TRINITY_DN561_c1_g3_i4.p1 TRINITY_DN561_c1_g3~~TRINITY_DN561_c1_g3_i4.p1  ORF type:complete len:704 (-),score=220.17 TRINITY_DN561_c1_g3_i4:337-2448(-)
MDRGDEEERLTGVKRKYPYAIQKWKYKTEDNGPSEKRQKKEKSNQVKKVKERERRSKMSESVQELRSIIPLCRDSEKKFNQAMVMAMAVDYITSLLTRIKYLENKLTSQGIEYEIISTDKLGSASSMNKHHSDSDEEADYFSEDAKHEKDFSEHISDQPISVTVTGAPSNSTTSSSSNIQKSPVTNKDTQPDKSSNTTTTTKKVPSPKMSPLPSLHTVESSSPMSVSPAVSSPVEVNREAKYPNTNNNNISGNSGNRFVSHPNNSYTHLKNFASGSSTTTGGTTTGGIGTVVVSGGAGAGTSASGVVLNNNNERVGNMPNNIVNNDNSKDYAVVTLHSNQSNRSSRRLNDSFPNNMNEIHDNDGSSSATTTNNGGTVHHFPHLPRGQSNYHGNSSINQVENNFSQNGRFGQQQHHQQQHQQSHNTYTRTVYNEFPDFSDFKPNINHDNNELGVQLQVHTNRKSTVRTPTNQLLQQQQQQQQQPYGQSLSKYNSVKYPNHGVESNQQQQRVHSNQHTHSHHHNGSNSESLGSRGGVISHHGSSYHDAPSSSISSSSSSSSDHQVIPSNQNFSNGFETHQLFDDVQNMDLLAQMGDIEEVGPWSSLFFTANPLAGNVSPLHSSNSNISNRVLNEFNDYDNGNGNHQTPSTATRLYGPNGTLTNSPVFHVGGHHVNTSTYNQQKNVQQQQQHHHNSSHHSNQFYSF